MPVCIHPRWFGNYLNLADISSIFPLSNMKTWHIDCIFALSFFSPLPFTPFFFRVQAPSCLRTWKRLLAIVELIPLGRQHTRRCEISCHSQSYICFHSFSVLVSIECVIFKMSGNSERWNYHDFHKLEITSSYVLFYHSPTVQSPKIYIFVKIKYICCWK